MRSRNIKPGFFKNEYLAECDPLARILFAGLWCMADREGRLEYRPKRIKAELLPYDECNVETLMNQLLQRGFIAVYGVLNTFYIAMPTFADHQNPNVKEAESTIPAPCPDGAGIVRELPLTEDFKLNTEFPAPMSVASTRRKCSRPEAPKINFNFETRTWENITPGEIEPWSRAYPACDVSVELNAMREWLLSNPEKRKLNYRKFVTNWLSRQQQRGGTRRGGTDPGPAPSNPDDGRPAEKYYMPCPNCGKVVERSAITGERCTHCESDGEVIPFRHLDSQSGGGT